MIVDRQSAACASIKLCIKMHDYYACTDDILFNPFICRCSQHNHIHYILPRIPMHVDSCVHERICTCIHLYIQETTAAAASMYEFLTKTKLETSRLVLVGMWLANEMTILAIDTTTMHWYRRKWCSYMAMTETFKVHAPIYTDCNSTRIKGSWWLI